METKVKNREWVKDAAIIFLVVLLILTFFSNTIMNRTLPEVATAEVTNGAIVAKVRGSGTVTANGKHQVKAKEIRTIRSVMIKAGQEVNAGDVLFVLGEGDATALEQAKETLRDLQFAYQKSAINIPSFDSTTYDRTITRAQRDMDEALQARDKAHSTYMTALKTYGEMTPAEIETAERQLSEYKTQMEIAEADLADARDNLNKLDDELTAAKDEVIRCQAIVDSLNAQIAALEAAIAAEESSGNSTSESDMTTNSLPGSDDGSLDTPPGSDDGSLDTPPGSDDGSLDTPPDLDSGLPEAETLAARQENEGKIVFLKAITPLNVLHNNYVRLSAQSEADLLELQQQLISAEADLAAATQRYNALEQEHGADSEWQEAYEQTKKIYEEAQERYYKALKEFEKRIPINALTYKEQYTNAENYYQTTIDDYFAALAAKDAALETFNRSVAVANVDLQQQAEKIRLQQEKIKSLAGDEENVITANVSGTVDTVDCTAGDTVLKDALLCTIEVPDMGHTLSFSVTNDQAQRLRIGDTATVSNYYWGNSITATLTTIRTDPKNPQTNKLLTFDLTGDVTTGAELTISVGQKSANYDLIVPNSAIKSDTNGNYVLAVSVKNSPLGNRYTARRVSVEVLANDDNNSAVVADLGNGDYVITTSSAPLSSGDMVRMADS